MPLLANHIAVVTGAGSGIGRAIAAGYAREGARIVLLDINVDAAAEAAKEIREAGGKADSFALDVTKREDCVAMAKQIAEKIGPVSILVNNAGIARRNGMLGADEAVIKDWEDVIAVNLTGVFNVTHALLPALRAARGRIVNIGSIQSFVHVRTPSSPAYTASKHGVLGFTKALAAELGREGVRVNAIGPGFIETPLNANARATNPELAKTFIAHTPLGRAHRGRYRRPRDLPRLRPVGLRHRIDRDGGWRIQDGVSSTRRVMGQSRSTILRRLSKVAAGVANSGDLRVG
jgi:NAD(P)-dependent dehydrogenase (short-subunit alcohol dehydrogenase family)